MNCSGTQTNVPIQKEKQQMNEGETRIGPGPFERGTAERAEAEHSHTKLTHIKILCII